MSKKLYVGGINYETTRDSLSGYFSQAGEVISCVLIIDKVSGRSKGFGFVEFSTEEEAAAAINMFNEQEFEGRTIYVKEARQKEQRDGRTQ